MCSDEPEDSAEDYANAESDELSDLAAEGEDYADAETAAEEESSELEGNDAPSEADDEREPGDEPAASPASEPRLSWNRRTFLKAAVLGTAAAAFLNNKAGDLGRGGIGFGPIEALANDLSDYPCTAQDIDVRNGIVLNEPCAAADCTGTFCALVRFEVFNSTSTGRYCISLHLPTTIIGGTTIQAQDVLLKTGYQIKSGTTCTPDSVNDCPVLTGTSTAAGKNKGESEHKTFMYGIIKGFPCEATEVCFGSKVPDDFTGKCTQTPGLSPCSTIGFATSPGNADCTTADPEPPRGQCRHRQVCVKGFGVTLECAGADCAATTAATCVVKCGEKLRLKATASGGTVGFDADCNPIECTTSPTMKLTGLGLPAAGISPDANGCFEVTNPQSGTYTVTATDCHGCTRTASKAVTTTPLTAPTLSIFSGPACDGTTVCQVSPCPPESGVTYSFEEVTCATGAVIGALSGTYNSANCRFTTTLPLGTTTCIQVRASNGTPACDQTDREDVPVNAAVVAGLVMSDAGCTGVLTFTGSATGGNGSYTFSFKLDNGSAVAGTGPNGNQFTYNPKVVSGALDTACHTVTVTATDTSTNKCSDTDSLTFSQCVTTTAGCTP